ncbi:hypothetical protein RJ641_021212 [Dillenia turbinata]|uniref:Uncharacterized protein n=1 Tax=Dillenia turbinata TaxID=194707 RepID=A0AAN8YUS2_9MAGN
MGHGVSSLNGIKYNK